MWNKIWGFLKESLGIISSIITIVVFFVGQSEYAFYLALFTLSWCGITVLVPLIQIFRTSRASKRIKIENKKIYRNLNKKFHKFFHKLRDCTADIDVNNITNRTELRRSCEVLSASICEIMELICKNIMGDNQISTCVKIVNAESVIDSDYEKWTIETLGRSPSTAPERTENDVDKVSLECNTDFLAIVKGKDSFIAFKDMTNIYEDFRKNYSIEYRNSRGEEFINYYRSCIIIPIEIDGSKAAEEVKNNMKGIKNKKLLLGFLCIDSMKIFNSDEELVVFETAIEAAKAIGDSMYLFMEKVLICQIRSSMKICDEQ